MTKKSIGFYLPLFAAAVVITGGVYYIFKNWFTGKDLTPQSAAEILPETAFAASFIETEPQAWSKLAKFGTPEAQTLVSQGLDSLTTQLATDEINYQQDIQPWVGGVMLAFMPNANTQEAQMLAIVGIKDKLKAQDFEKKLKSQQGQTVKETNYQGIKITNYTNQDFTLSTAIVGDYLVVGDDTQTVEQTIDTFKGKPSYADKPAAQKLFSQSLTLKNPVAQVYIADYGELVKQSLANSTQETPLPAEALQQLEQIGAVVVGMGIEERGLHLQAVTSLNPDSNQSNPQLVAGEALKQFPQETLAVINGQSLNQGWNYLVSQSGNNSEIQQLITQIRQMSAAVNLDADREIFGWMNGEFALGIVAPEQNTIPGLNLGAMLVIQTTDRSTAEGTLSELTNLVQSQGVQVEQNPDKNLTQWRVQGNVLLSYSWPKKDYLTLTLAMPLATETNTRLTDNQSFKNLTNNLPANNVGSLYIDMNKSLIEVFKLVPQGSNLNPNALAFLNSLEAVAVTATIPSNTTSQMDMLIALKPANSR